MGAEQRTIIQQYGDCTLAVDGRAVTFGTARRGLNAAPTSYYSTWHYNCLCTTKG